MKEEEACIIMKTTRCFVFLFLIVVFFLVGCAHPSNRQILDETFEWIEKYPDSAAWVLENNIIQTSLNDGDKADYWYLLTYIHLQQGRSLVNDSLINYSVQYYRKQGNLHRLFNACRFAAWQVNFGDKDKKRQERLFQETVATAEIKKDTTFLSDSYRLLANFYTDENKPREAIAVCWKLTSLSEEDKSRGWYILGLNYIHMGMRDSSFFYLSKAAELAQRLKSSDAFHYMRNYADYLAAKNPKEALDYLSYIRKVYPDESLNLTLATIYESLGQQDSTDYYLAGAEKDIQSEGLSEAARKVLVKTIRTVKNGENGLAYTLGQLAPYCDSISSVTFCALQNERELLFSRNKLLQDNLKSETSRQRTLLILFVVLFLFTVTVSIVCFYIRYRRDKLLEAEEKLDALQHLLREATCGNVHHPLASPDKPDSAFFRKVLLQQLGVIRLMATSPTQQNKELLQQMARIANEDVPTEALLVWEDLYPIIDTVYVGFYSRLVKLADGRLSDKELQLCCLLCAEFSTKEISVLTQQSVRTVYQRKTNIRHALGMNEKDDIVAYIDNER